MQAAFLRNWRAELERANRARAGMSNELARRGGLDLPCGPSHPYLRMPVFAANPADRHRRLAEARDRGLGFSLAYPGPVSEIPEVESVIGPRQFPNALRVATHLLTVPTHEWITPRDVNGIVTCLNSGTPGTANARNFRTSGTPEPTKL
jgi:hypothetical protein